MSRGLDEVIRLGQEYEDCRGCDRCETRTHMLLGAGSVRADLMVIGSFPTREDDEAGAPFSGRAGRFLMNMFAMQWPATEEMAIVNEIDREDDDAFFEKLRDYLDNHVFWTNIVCCAGAEDTNLPSAAAIKACHPRLERLIYAVDPMLILALGKQPTTLLLGRQVKTTGKRGSLYDVEILSPVTRRPVRYPVMALLDPAYLLRKGDHALVTKGQGETYETLHDLKYALSLLDETYQDLFGTSFPDKPEEYKR